VHHIDVRKCELSLCNSNPYRRNLGFSVSSLRWAGVLGNNIESMEPANIMLV
jgi:hypothetical protein